MSPLMERLCRELAESADPERRAELSARIAALEARAGDFAQARQRVEGVRGQFGDGRSGRVTVWIMVAEGLIHHYEKFSGEARDRMSRAQLLSVAMKFKPVAALSSAWLAHIDFESGAYETMIMAISSALQFGEPANHDANSRVAAVLANAFTICGDHAEALRWFGRAREEATKAGDRATVEAILYNRAAFLATWARAENCIASVSSDFLHSIRQEFRSTRNFQDITRFATLPAHTQLWDGRLLMLEGDFEAAILKLNEIRDQPRFAGHNFSAQYIDLEIAFCLAKAARLDEALAKLEAIDISSFDAFDVDERMVADWMRWQLALVDSRFGNQRLLEERHTASVGIYRMTMNGLLGRLEEFRKSGIENSRDQ